MFSGVGTISDKKGVHALSLTETTRTTMHLVSTRSGPVQSLGRAYTTTMFTPKGAGYRITYPSTWSTTEGTAGNFEIASPDSTGLIVGSKTTTSGDITDPNYVSQFLRAFGTPLSTVISTVRTTNEQQYGIADAVIRLKGQALEAQCEVRVRADGGGMSVLVGIVSLGLPGLTTRPPDLAREYEQVQRSLDSVQVAGSQA
jgi:hypothetical protein